MIDKVSSKDIAALEEAARQQSQLGSSRFSDGVKGIEEIEQTIERSLERTDPSWFLTEETRKTRERFLYLSAFSTAVLATSLKNFSINWPVTAELDFVTRVPVDISLILVTTGLGLNYLISAQSEIAQHTYKWQIAQLNFDNVTKQIQMFEHESGKLLEGKKGDGAYAPKEIRERLTELQSRSKELGQYFSNLKSANDRILSWGRRMPILTFTCPVIIMLLALITRMTFSPSEV